jgi:hypothetical protein
MARSDWVPRKGADVALLMDAWKGMLGDSAKRAAFGWKDEDCAAVLLVLGAFLKARADYLAVNSTGNRLTKDVARVPAERAMRVFANASVRCNDRMTDADRLVLGIRRRDGGSRQPDPVDLVGFELCTVAGDHRVIADFRVEGSERRGKGRYYAVEGRYWVRALDEAPPRDANAAGWRSELCTATPWEVGLNGADAGKRVYVAMRWVNRSVGKDGGRRGKGLWSVIRGIILQ